MQLADARAQSPIVSLIQHCLFFDYLKKSRQLHLDIFENAMRLLKGMIDRRQNASVACLFSRESGEIDLTRHYQSLPIAPPKPPPQPRLDLISDSANGAMGR